MLISLILAFFSLGAITSCFVYGFIIGRIHTNPPKMMLLKMSLVWHHFLVNSSLRGRFPKRVMLHLWIIRYLKKLQTSFIKVIFWVRVDLDASTRLNSMMVLMLLLRSRIVQSRMHKKEFENEVDLLCKFKHSNIISLLGFNSDNETRLIMYELMQKW